MVVREGFDSLGELDESEEDLLDRAWGRDVYVEIRTVDVHVGRLRRALNRGAAADPIRTVRGSGYSFDEKF